MSRISGSHLCRSEELGYMQLCIAVLGMARKDAQEGHAAQSREALHFLMYGWITVAAGIDPYQMGEMLVAGGIVTRGQVETERRVQIWRT